MHPFGESGMWLSRTLLAVLIDEMYQYNIPNKQEYPPMGNPISKKLLSLAPSDGNPQLTDIISSYYLCPYSDPNKLEAHFSKKVVIKNYTSYNESIYLV